ncbi:MAG: phytoene desaturase family protein [Streptosporangiales bacterium]
MRQDAIIVGSGPNGLAAAVTLAAAGLGVRVYEAAGEPGGGCRSDALTRPGFLHDTCSAVHPLAVASPFFRAFGLRDRVDLRAPDVAYAHPLDGGRAGVVRGTVEETAGGLGVDAETYASLLGPLVRAAPDLVSLLLAPPLRRLPTDVLGTAAMARSSLRLAGRGVARAFGTEEARAVITGAGAHSMQPLSSLTPAPMGLLLTLLAHTTGWPLPRGGSQAITDALVTALCRLGGEVVTGHQVRTLRELPPAHAVLLDVVPEQLLAMVGDEVSGSYARALRRFRHGAGVCKVDYALSGPVPWANTACRSAGTVHVGGRWDEVALALEELGAGRHPQRPFVLVAQPSLVDRDRAPAGQHALWAYCGVPAGSDVDMSERIDAQIERFAPGFRDLVLDRHVRTAAGYQAYNPSYLGGDMSGGAMTPDQLVFRPAPRWDPYATPAPGVFLCSASTPPGAGVHGMCGYQAALSALRKRFGIHKVPALATAGR